jgi:hypothetical protein
MFEQASSVVELVERTEVQSLSRLDRFVFRCVVNTHS